MDTCIGIDISKNSFDVHRLADGSGHHIDYTGKNIRNIVERFISEEPQLIAMEATGGYEIPLATELFAAGLPVSVVNPKRIRDFAKAVGQTAKTDKIDARIIARFGAMLQPPPSDAPDENSFKIRSLTERKRQLLAKIKLKIANIYPKLSKKPDFQKNFLGFKMVKIKSVKVPPSEHGYRQG